MHQTTAEKLAALRSLMKEKNLKGYLIPMADPFQNEFVPSHFQRLEYMTGFTGSAGMAVILEDTAALFVDGRYTVQAAAEVEEGLFSVCSHGFSALKKFLQDQSFEEEIGFDPWTLTSKEAEFFSGIAVEGNLVDRLWEERPMAAPTELTKHPEGFAGESAVSKCRRLGKPFHEKGLSSFLITKGDRLSWLLNIRGQDVPNTPIPFAYACLHATGIVDFFTDAPNAEEVVDSATVNVYPLAHVTSYLEEGGDCVVGFDPHATPYALSRLLKKGVAAQDPTLLPRACKNPTEQEGARECHQTDGVAVTKFLYALEQRALAEQWDERYAMKVLAELRGEGKDYRGQSFETISATGAHSAWCHYHAHPHTNQPLEQGEIYLVDSGGQYLSGTTDVTRTVILGGEATEEQRTHSTLVLKGHIALSRMRFPKGTTGAQLDVLARQYLWDQGLDFAHGTGHGVGSYLGVHEGPQGISPRSISTPLMPGMILSNEPGYYREGHYGIRHENLVLVVESESYPGFLEFENLTWAPFDPNLVAVDLLTPEEKKWLHDYHQEVFAQVASILTTDESAWLFEILKQFIIEK